MTFSFLILLLGGKSLSCSFMLIFSSFSEQVNFTTIGMITGTSAMYEYAAMAIGAKRCGANLMVVKMAVGPSAPPIMPSDAVIRFDDRNAEIQLTDYVITCRLIEGRYPNYNSVIPTDNPFRVTVDRLAFISALRRVSVFASQSSALIKLHVDQGTLTVSAQDLDFSTSAEEHIMCEYEGMAMSIGFNGPFLIDVLNSITGNDIVLELADPSRAGVITPAEQEENEDLIMLLMPMMLKD